MMAGESERERTRNKKRGEERKEEGWSLESNERSTHRENER